MSPDGRLRVALVDDHAVVRAGYRRLIELEPDMRVVGEYGDALSAFEALADGGAPEVDVAVLDLSMPGLCALEMLGACRARRPGLAVLVFTMHDSMAMLQRCLDAGAAGYVTKSSPPELLVAAVRRVARGESVLSPDMAAVATQHAARRAPHHSLSARELTVLRELVAGLGVEAIAQRLQISPKTVANHQAQIRGKLAVSGTVELWQYARRHGLI